MKQKDFTNLITPINVLWASLFIIDKIIEEVRIANLLNRINSFFAQPCSAIVGLVLLSVFFYQSPFKTKCQIVKWSSPFIFLGVNTMLDKKNWDLSFSIICALAIYTIFIICIIYDNFLGRIKKTNIAYKDSSLLSDDPKIDINDDRYKRAEYAESIVKSIKETKNSRSFNISISGKWGSGKTSFMNFMKGLMDNDKDHFIAVNYNPWDFKEDKIIGIDLLKSICSKLSQEKELQDDFIGLLNSLQGINNNYLYKILPFLLLKNKQKSIQEYRSEIGQVLIRKEKKLVVFLDDLDRLDGKEILELFKTIRNSFDISNTYFIVGFYTDYVQKQIEPLIITNDANHYMEKMFQMPLFLPSNMDYSFYTLLKELIAENFDDHRLDLQKILNLSSKREVNAIINAMKVLSKSPNFKIGDYSTDALVILELIKLRRPDIYKYLAYNYDNVLRVHKRNIRHSDYINASEDPDFDSSDYESNFKGTHDSLIWYFTSAIDEKDEDGDNLGNIPSYTYLKYFKYALTEQEVSKVDLWNAINRESDEEMEKLITSYNREDIMQQLQNWNALWQNNFVIKHFIQLYFRKSDFYNQQAFYFIFNYNNYKSFEEFKNNIKILEDVEKQFYIVYLIMSNWTNPCFEDGEEVNRGHIEVSVIELLLDCLKNKFALDPFNIECFSDFEKTLFIIKKYFKINVDEQKKVMCILSPKVYQ